MAAAVVLFATTLAQAADVCVSSSEELNDALISARSGGDWTIRIQVGKYEMHDSVLAGIEYADHVAPEDADQSGKLDRDDNIQYVLKGNTSLALYCGYNTGCNSRSIDAENTILVNSIAPTRLAIRVQETAKLTISGCGFENETLWLVHGGRGSFEQDTLNSITGFPKILLGRNRFSGTASGPELLIQEEGKILESYIGGDKQKYTNLSVPNIFLRQNIFTGDSDFFHCAVQIGDDSDESDSHVSWLYNYDTLTSQFEFPELFHEPHGRIDLLHNSVGGNAGCGVELLTNKDLVRLSNNIFAANGKNQNDIDINGGRVYSEFNLYDKLGGASYHIAVGDIGGSPGFVDPGAGNLHLRSDSPALDVATPFSMLGEPVTDAVDQARIWGSAPDMGAYEFFMKVQ